MSRVDELKSQIAECEEIVGNPRSRAREIIKATARHSRLTTELIKEERRIHEAKMAAMHDGHEAKMAVSIREYEEARQAPGSLFSSLTVEDLYGGPLPPHLQ